LLPVVEHSRLALVVPALSPLVAVASLLATRTFQAGVGIGLAVGLVALFRRRWFCRWVCPTGTCAEIAARGGSRLGRRSPKLPPLGQWIAILTLGGALLGYPFLLWLDPLAMFGGLFSLRHAASSPAAWWFAVSFAGVLLVSLAWPGAWCMRFCPLGATQDILAILAGATKEIAARSPNAPTTRSKVSAGLPRRAVLGAMAGVAWATAARTVRAGAPPPLRPPGALDETRFVGLCIRCGNCIRACPSTIIRPDAGESGIAGLLAPVLDFRRDYCREDCTRCTDVCPSGAIRRLTLDEKPRARIGFPKVDMNVCLLGDDRDCAACRTWCPYDAVALVFSEIEYTLTPQIDLEKCPGCGACQVACPTVPVKAITIVPPPGIFSRVPI
jgi:ferredoxin-type protein NapF